ncbi:MAG: response regulator [Planctomycetota bacterium]|nr:response regulator [Planctomycetota bacterium]
MKPSVLIVDDSLTVRMDLDEAFREAGFETAMCASLATAREALLKTVYSLAVLDILLPDGDGLDLLKEIRQSPARAKLPVMLLTTEAEVRDRIRGLKTGADEYVGKPYDSDYVVSRARQLVHADAEAAGPRVRHILVIDDSPTFRNTMREALEAANYSVVTAESGEEGLKRAATLRPHVIVVDGMLPGIDGATVIRRIRSDVNLRNTPCILLTGSEDPANEVRVLEAGADAYLRKESSLDVLLARIAAVMRSSNEPTAAGGTAGLLGPKKVLAVDDSRTYLEELSDHLREEGFDLVLAQSGEEALELLAVQPVDCVLLDLMMPGLSGQETCRRIKQSPAWRDIPLIILTALEENDAMIAGINAGADDYITKSGDFEVLKARVRAQIRRKQFEDENRRIREELMQKEAEAAEARAAKQVAEMRERMLVELQHKNEELESFSYSVSHDLRAPLRALDGFSHILLEDYGGNFDEEGKRLLASIGGAAKRMSTLIDALLALSRTTRGEMNIQEVDLSAIAQTAADDLRRAEPDRRAAWTIQPQVLVEGDQALLRAAMVNLLQNAWKYSAKVPEARIEFGALDDPQKGRVYFVRDNGAGFDMANAGSIFAPFKRLHTEREFQGTGIGLATVHRIIRRHEGKIWAEARVNEGASFFFTLGGSLRI